jgi:hypothetical protein
MLKKLAGIVFYLALFSSHAQASTYCFSQYEEEIKKVNASLGSILTRTEQVQDRLRAIYVRTAAIGVEMANAATKVPPDVSTIQKLGQEQADLNKEKTRLEAEAYALQDQAVPLKGTIPAELQGKLRGCVAATAPADQLVNLTIQILAIMSTGGASLALPPKALYVDMGAVLNGYPTGGPDSAINQARQSALNALGIGGENNDIGKTIKDPVGAIRNLFH